MQRLSEILKDMKAKASAEAVVLTSSEGLVLDAVQDDGLDLESLAAYAASSITACEHIGESAQCGTPESVIIIYQGKALVMAPLGPVVAMMLGKGTQIGNLRLQLKKAMPDLSAALEEELELSPASAVSPPQPEPAAVPEPPPQAPSVDPGVNGNKRRVSQPTVQRSSVNLR